MSDNDPRVFFAAERTLLRFGLFLRPVRPDPAPVHTVAR